MKLDHTRIPSLLDDLDRAVSEMKDALGADAATWASGRPGKWTSGQHAEHIAKTLDGTGHRFEAAAAELREGRLGGRPWRSPPEAFVVWMLMRDPFPRGGRAPAFVLPEPTPSRQSVFARLDAARARLRAMVESLSDEQRARLWAPNPFMDRYGWHYRLFEILRVQANHTRHHTKLALEGVTGSKPR
jgi:hypothetical protein